MHWIDIVDRKSFSVIVLEIVEVRGKLKVIITIYRMNTCFKKFEMKLDFIRFGF